MKILVLLAAAVLLATTGCKEGRKSAATTPLESYADSLFQASIDSAEIAGAAILVYQKGETLLKKSYGYASLELSVPMPTDGIFDIGSVTKEYQQKNHGIKSNDIYQKIYTAFTVRSLYKRGFN